MQRIQYPMSTFKRLFKKFTDANHLRVSIPNSTLVWLSEFSGTTQQHASTVFTPQEELIHKQDDRRLFFMLLRILMPDEARSTIDAAERADQLKWAHVDKNEFEDAARFKQQHDTMFSSLGDFVTGDSRILPAHLQQLFDLLAVESTG